MGENRRFLRFLSHRSRETEDPPLNVGPDLQAAGARAPTPSATGPAARRRQGRVRFRPGAGTLEQIARDAGVGIGTLYRHFPTREALVEAVYRKELADLCASAAELLAAQPPERALRAWMDRFADYVTAKREMADAIARRLRLGQPSPSPRPARNHGGHAGDRQRRRRGRDAARDVRPEDVVAMIVGAFTATSLAGGREQRARMFDLLVDAVRRQGTVRGP